MSQKANKNALFRFMRWTHFQLNVKHTVKLDFSICMLIVLEVCVSRRTEILLKPSRPRTHIWVYIIVYNNV